MDGLGRRIKWWSNLPVAHKLYAVVGIMALLIATELFTLLFAMDTLSAVRAFVGGEGIWSKAQKDAVLDIQDYVRTGDEKHYQDFQKHLEIPRGDHLARLELEKPELDVDQVTKWFVIGKIHPHDVVPMTRLIRRFYSNYYIARAIASWRLADFQIAKLIEASERLHKVIKQPITVARNLEVREILAEIIATNDKLTSTETEFSAVLGEASRWLEHLLMILLVIAVATIESTGLFLTFTFSRGLGRVLNELNLFAGEVGAGNFSRTVPVRSRDELGQLADALNKMANSLKEISSEREIAEKANNLKNLFLANMSHEVRTPLNAIIGFVDLLRDPGLSPSERDRYLEIIERTGLGLATIINDILDISKVEAGKLEVERAVYSLPQILKDIHVLLNLRCEEKGIELRFVYADIPKFIVIDGTRFKQILLNVIGNAIKFTSRGSVTVSFSTLSGSLTCRIEDTGIGISDNEVEKLFHTFSQGDPTVRKKFGGTGLGLVLSRRLAQLLGGDVLLENSRIGVGSTFVVTVALEVANPNLPAMPASASEAVDPLAGLNVLVVEDSIDNQLLATKYLTKAGARVRVANHGGEALELIQAERFDILLMDMQMPVMDGYTTTELIRRNGIHIPIIALTAHAMRDEIQKCLSVGCDDYLSKPFKRENLISLVSRHSRIAS